MNNSFPKLFCYFIIRPNGYLPASGKSVKHLLSNDSSNSFFSIFFHDKKFCYIMRILQIIIFTARPNQY